MLLLIHFYIKSLSDRQDRTMEQMELENISPKLEVSLNKYFPKESVDIFLYFEAWLMLAVDQDVSWQEKRI